MEKMKMHSPDLIQANIDKLAELFPNCVTEAEDGEGHLKRAIDFDQLRQEFSDHLVDGPGERYQLNWPGKREALLAANAPIAKTLRPCREESVDFDATRNLFIEGDNLDALKLLQETYLNKVKMIYIDPPYNTGQQFIYNDDFAETSVEYFERSQQYDDQGIRLKANTESNGRFHSDWMSMIFPRLKLARNLLRDDGVIFISINDSEVANLRRLCDEVFGDSNFVAQIVWQRSKKGDSKLIANVHEYIVCYARSKVSTVACGLWRKQKEGAAEVLAHYKELRSEFKGDHKKLREAMQAFYRGLPAKDPRKAHKHYCQSDERGLYFAADFAGPDDGRASRPRHDIIHPVTGKPCKKPSTGWRWDKAKTEWALSQKPPRIHFGEDETTIPTRKTYLEENIGEPFSSVFYRDGRSATLEVERLIGPGWFQFPKNTDVISDLIELVTDDGDIVLDFFAGSGTTAHAVLNLNNQHQTSRTFILTQLPEPTGHEQGFKTIADICKERIRRAGQGIFVGEESNSLAIDIGFRVLKVDTSNMKEVYYTPDAVTQEGLFGQIENIKEDRTNEDLLFQVLLDWGVDLSLPIRSESIAGKRVFLVDQDALAACFETGIDEEFVKLLAERKPLRAVFRDSGYGNDGTKINVEQIFKLISPVTEVKTL